MVRATAVCSVTSGERESLIIAHMPLVARIASKIKRRRPPCYDLVDLISMGTIGLIQAADKFDELSFSRPGFATRIPFGAFARKRIKGEILEHCRKRRWEEETRPEVNLSNVRSAVLNPELQAGQVTEDRLIRRAIEMLPVREALVIKFHYYGDTPIKLIACMPGLEVVPSRVSQLHRSALGRLRESHDLDPFKGNGT
jgi:RNA polymerase sigma factor (sigma-70 family)